MEKAKVLAVMKGVNWGASETTELWGEKDFCHGY